MVDGTILRHILSTILETAIHPSRPPQVSDNRDEVENDHDIRLKLQSRLNAGQMYLGASPH